MSNSSKQAELSQYFTPTWAAELLVARHYADLGRGDVVLEPTCGDGRFLMAIPPEVEAYGVELDAEQAAKAAANTGRNVIVGDFTRVELPRKPTVILGNPPYQAGLIDDILDRSFDLLEYEGRVGFLLPVYYLQTASKVVDLARRWSMAQELLPRNLFENMAKPLMWVNFVKARRTVLSGFFLYAETAALADMHKDFREMFVGNQAKATCWRDAVQMALETCGGRATLSQLYAAIENNKPFDTNPWWREKIRQMAGRHFVRVGHGEYALQQAA